MELREVHRQRGKNSRAPRIAKEDVVIIHDEGQPRSMWGLGLVKEVLIDNDGEVRAVVLQVAKQGSEAKHLSRPVQRLYPLEMPAEHGQSTDTPSQPTNQPGDQERVDSAPVDETLDNKPPATVNVSPRQPVQCPR